MYVLYESLTNILELKDFRFSLWQVFLPCMLYESLTNMLELKDFRFSLWQVFLPWGLYEKAASKATSAEPPPRWAIGTGQLSCLQFRSGPIARRGGGGIIPFGSASTTLYLLCPAGHARYKKIQACLTLLLRFVVGKPGSQIPVHPWRLYLNSHLS